MFTNSATRYILTIYELSDGGNAVRSVDIATALKVSRASVVKMLKYLSCEGLVVKPYYGDVQLTDLGVRQANRLYTQYTLLHAFFERNLCVKSDCARKDAIACLSALSDQSKDKLIDIALRQS